MPIEWDAAGRQFHLRTDGLSVILRVLEDGSLGHVHLGGPLASGRSYRHLGTGAFEGFANRVGDPVALVYPTAGIGDFRVPALTATLPDGSTALRLRYVSHEVTTGKPVLPGLPATYVEDPSEADTLSVELRDDLAHLEVTLSFTVFAGRPVVARHARIRNAGEIGIRLGTAMSCSLDLPDADWTLSQLSGAWGRERHVITRALRPGRQSISSRRGHSGHEHNPFLLLARPEATETTGEVLGVSLVYSGNHLGEVEVEPSGSARLRMGIDPDDFSWVLEPGETFTTPEAVVAWSDAGRGGVSDALHDLYRLRLARGRWRDAERPVLLNNWEATYFGFDEARILEIAASAAELGIELFVLDDGWFGRRDDDTTSLGDWTADARKLPNGVEGLARRVNELGLRFGIWIEPEMVSPASHLFEAHPDWAIGAPGRARTESRNQLVLDLARPEVVDHLFETMSTLLSSAPIDYVKWDMNRSITEPWSAALPADRQGAFFHRYILGLYVLWDRLTRAFPDVLFESCAGGGGRFDPGILAYAPQGWTSDTTDAIERLRIQWGTSFAYPLSAMGAHVSAVPNHQVGRVAPLSTRAAVAFFGVLGYELDPTALERAEREEIADQVAFYRLHRALFQRGRFARLVGPWDGDGNATAWMVVAPDRAAAIVGWYQVLNRPVPGPVRLRLRGLDPDQSYRISLWPEPFDATVLDDAEIRGGDELLHVGLVPTAFGRDAAGMGDFTARLFVLEAV